MYKAGVQSPVAQRLEVTEGGRDDNGESHACRCEREALSEEALWVWAGRAIRKDTHDSS